MSDLRMPELNKVFLTGRLTRAPELRYLPSGTPLCKMGLAVSRNYKTREGDRREETLFIDDNAHNIDTAKLLGFETIHFTPDVNLKNVLTEMGML